MDQAVVEDLKQFITTTVSTEVRAARDDLRMEIKRLDLKLSRKLDSLSGYVAEALDSSNDANDWRFRSK